MSWEIRQGDCVELLDAIEPESVQTCVTSPPYYNLRNYGHPGQIGLEATPQEYVSRLVEVFREVHRVLRPDGTLWLNLGDSYAGSWGNQGRKKERGTQREINKPMLQKADERYPVKASNTGKIPEGSGLKPKDLIGIPWRVALALQADGWWLRADIIWHKPNPMPSSVTDRPTISHEYLFLLTKSARYYYDADAIREEDSGHVSGNGFAGRMGGNRGHATVGGNGSTDRFTPGTGRNKRSVWTITTRPFRDAHFATFPPELVEPCIKAGTKVGDLVLDPFSGAATVGLVARRLQRRYIGLELNPEYCEMGRRRVESDAPLFNR